MAKFKESLAVANNRRLSTLGNIIGVDHRQMLENAPLIREPISHNLLYLVSLPLLSESKAFLLFLMNYKLKSQELSRDYGHGHDDYLIQLEKQLVSSDLTKLRASCAILLHQSKIDYYTDTFDVSQIYLSNPKIASEIFSMLHNLILTKIFKMRLDPSANGLTSLHNNAELSVAEFTRIKTPLWRLLMLKCYKRLKSSIFNDWKLWTLVKHQRRTRDEDITRTLNEENRSNILTMMFTDWLNLARSRCLKREEEMITKCIGFTRAIQDLILQRMATFLNHLYFNYAITLAGDEKTVKLKRLVIFSRWLIKNPDYPHYELYYKAHCIFTEWLKYTRYLIKLERDVDLTTKSFLKNRILNAWYDVTQSRLQRRRNTQLGLMEHTKLITLDGYLTAWSQLLKCKYVFKSLTCSPVKNLIKCFYHWKSYKDRSLELKGTHLLIKDSYNGMLLERSMSQLVRVYNGKLEERAKIDRSERYYNDRILYKYLDIWHNFLIVNRRLRSISLEIRSNVNETTKSYCFNLMFNVTYFHCLEKRRLKGTLLNAMRYTLSSSRLSKILESHLYRMVREALRDVFDELRSNRDLILKYENIINNHKVLYGALTIISDLPLHYTRLGVQCLKNFVNSTYKYRKIKNSLSTRLTRHCFIYWKYLSAYNSYWVKRVFSIDFAQTPPSQRSYYKLRCKIILNKLVGGLHYWKGLCNFVACDQDTLNRITSFSSQSRDSEGIRILKEYTMAQKWHALCVHRAETFEEYKLYKLKKLVFSILKSLIPDDYTDVSTEDGTATIEELPLDTNQE